MTKPPATPADLGALSHLAPELAQTLASVAGDIALVVDVSGVIRNVAIGGREPLPAAAQQWVGRRWTETASDETRGKIELLLREAVDSGVSRRREVNVPMGGVDVPVAYAAIRLGRYGPLLAVGRDLRAVAAIQQRFADTQQQMEREYWKKRQAVSRYRLLFQAATDAVLVVDGATLNVVEANRAAAVLFDAPLEALIGRPVTQVAERASRPAVQALLVQARESGRPAEARTRLAHQAISAAISAAPFRSDGALHLLVRVRRAEAPEHVGAAPLAELVERIPDGVVITDSAGGILMANPAFLELCGLADESEARGQPLGRWLGQFEGDPAAILAEVRSRGVAPQLRTVVRSPAATYEVEISAALLEEADQERIGFTVRRAAEGSAAVRPVLEQLAQAVEHLSLQMGQEPLPLLLRQVSDLAERHFIAAAMQRCASDLDAAAALLGVTRHSLELRLRRHGLIGDSDSVPPASDEQH